MACCSICGVTGPTAAAIQCSRLHAYLSWPPARDKQTNTVLVKFTDHKKLRDLKSGDTEEEVMGLHFPNQHKPVTVYATNRRNIRKQYQNQQMQISAWTCIIHTV